MVKLESIKYGVKQHTIDAVFGVIEGLNMQLPFGWQPISGIETATDVFVGYKFAEHIHDILVRILLQMLDYKGTYQPILIKVQIDAPLNWVKANNTLLANAIGY